MQNLNTDYVRCAPLCPRDLRRFPTLKRTFAQAWVARCCHVSLVGCRHSHNGRLVESELPQAALSMSRQVGASVVFVPPTKLRISAKNDRIQGACR
jgi:hypothetical protein